LSLPFFKSTKDKNLLSNNLNYVNKKIVLILLLPKKKGMPITKLTSLTTKQLLC